MTLSMKALVAVSVMGLFSAEGRGQSSPHVDTSTIAARLSEKLAAHPRLLLNGADDKTLVARAAADPRGAKLWRRVLDNADAVLALPPLERKMTGKRLLFVSRDARDRIGTLAIAYRGTGDRRYLDAARACLLSVAAFSDYNPGHFLDVAEMTAGLAVGYDWLHGELSPDDRAAIRAAIVEKGLKPSFAEPAPSWVNGKSNWNQVCHGGLVLGALAVAEDAPEIARAVVERAVANVPTAMRQYAPDGAYPEGATYWTYGTTYNALLIAGLQSALGSDFGLLGQPGFAKAIDYRLHIVGPTGLAFAYSDGSERGGADVAAAAFYLAAQRKDDALLFNELRSLERLLATPVETKGGSADWLLMTWAAAPGEAKAPAATHYVADGPTPVGLHRSSWDADSTFVGIVGGSPSTSHAHMDVGSFVLDAGGQRWASDLGLQPYTQLEARKIKLFDVAPTGDRWRVFRLGAMSHSILTVDGQDQVVTGRAEIMRHSPWFTVLETSGVYAGQLSAASRGVLLRDDRSVRVQDEIKGRPDAAVTVRWAMLTKADVRVEGDDVTLSRGGKTLRMTVASPAGVNIKRLAADGPNDYDAPNPGASLIVFEVPVAAGAAATIVVDFNLIGGAVPATRPAAGPVTPLDAW